MLFGTSGIRGDAEKLFTNQFCFDIGRAFATFLELNGTKRGGVAIGMDPRESSQRIKNDIARGLSYEGVKVFDEGYAPSPAMNNILIADESIAGSIMITGSHIRPDFNGVKFFTSKKEILKGQEKDIENIYEFLRSNSFINSRYRNNVDMTVENRAIDIYQKMLLNLVYRTGYNYPLLKIVLDLGNGCQSKVMPELFEILGLETVLINNDPIPERFIARDTETEDAVKDLQEKVRETGADMGIAFDGDGDRVVFVDEDGRFITGDYAGSIIAKYSDTPFVITPTNTSQVVDHIGKLVIRTKVGSPYVVEAMQKHSATFGFEANGGGISKEVMLSRDAGSTMIKMLDILDRTNMTLKELVNTLPQFFVCRKKVECPTNVYKNIMENVRTKFVSRNDKIESIDGLKIWKSDNSWILFRPSSNAPEFRVFAEARTDKEASDLCNEGIKFVTGNLR